MNACFHQLRLVIEYLHEEPDEQHDHAPEQQAGDYTDDGGKFDGLTYTPILLGPVVKADDWLGRIGQPHDRHIEDLTDGGHDRHDTHIQVAAIGLQHIVAGDLHRAVGGLHHEAGQTQAYDLLQTRQLHLHILPLDLVLGLFSGEESQHPRRR